MPFSSTGSQPTQREAIVGTPSISPAANVIFPERRPGGSLACSQQLRSSCLPDMC